MRKKSKRQKKTSKKKNRVKVISLSELSHAIAKVQQSKKSLLVHIFEKDLPSAENILKDSNAKYGRTKAKNQMYRLELFPSQEIRQTLDEIVRDFMSQFEEM